MRDTRPSSGRRSSKGERAPIEVLGLSLIWKRLTALPTTIRKMTTREALDLEKATPDAFSMLLKDRTMVEIKRDEVAAAKRMRAENRRERTAYSKRYNAALRSHGICPKKFNAAVKSNHGLSKDEFAQLVKTECRLEE